MQTIQHTCGTASARVKSSASSLEDLAAAVNDRYFRKSIEGGAVGEAAEPAGHLSKADEATGMISNGRNGQSVSFCLSISL